MTVAKRRAVDLFRRNRELRSKYAQIGRALEAEGDAVTPDFDRAFSDDIDDDLLRLIFTACHPVLPVQARVALTLRLLGGLTTAEIARAYLVPEPTVAQRIVRAKKTLASAGVPFEVPGPAERPARLSSVLEVIYLIFNEGYSATAGRRLDAPRPVPGGAAAGPAAGRDRPRRARGARPAGADGDPGLPAPGPRRARRGAGAAARSGPGALGPAADQPRPGRPGPGRAARRRTGPYALQAAIAACHARAFRPEETDWTRIAELYAVLAQQAPSPVVELNRAVAVSMAHGPQAGLDLVDQLLAVPSLRAYHLLPSVRGDLLMKLGRPAEAQAEFERAAELTSNVPERELSAERARAAAAQANRSSQDPATERSRSDSSR